MAQFSTLNCHPMGRTARIHASDFDSHERLRMQARQGAAINKMRIENWEVSHWSDFSTSLYLYAPVQTVPMLMISPTLLAAPPATCSASRCLREFRVLTGTYSAEYGRYSGGV